MNQAAGKKAVSGEQLRASLEKGGILLVFALLFLLFSVLSAKFCTTANIFNIFKQVSHIAILAIGMTFVFLYGGMDLSAGANIFLGAVCVAALVIDRRGGRVNTTVGLGL